MGKVYKSKNGSSCKLCKPHKNGWANKNKAKNRLIIDVMARDIDILKKEITPDRIFNWDV